MTDEQKLQLMSEWDIHLRDRDPRLNTDYPGSLMIVEGSPEVIERDYELPTKDGANGPWCIVGDDHKALVDFGWKYMDFLNPPEFKKRLAAEMAATKIRVTPHDRHGAGEPRVVPLDQLLEDLEDSHPAELETFRADIGRRSIRLEGFVGTWFTYEIVRATA